MIALKFLSCIAIALKPYRGAGQALTHLLGGQVQVMFDVTSSSIGYIRAGKLRALAVTTATRAEALPDVPTVGEFVPGYEATSPRGVGAPKDTPAGIVDKLNKEINAALADPKPIPAAQGTDANVVGDPQPVTIAQVTDANAVGDPQPMPAPAPHRRAGAWKTRSIGRVGILREHHWDCAQRFHGMIIVFDGAVAECVNKSRIYLLDLCPEHDVPILLTQGVEINFG